MEELRNAISALSDYIAVSAEVFRVQSQRDAVDAPSDRCAYGRWIAYQDIGSRLGAVENLLDSKIPGDSGKPTEDRP